MKVNCNHCGKKLNIPDEKIPDDKVVTISCPACKNKINIDKQTAMEKNGQSSSVATDEQEKPVEKDQEAEIEIIDPSKYLDEVLEIPEEGAKRALVCDIVYQDKISTALKELDYHTKTVTSVNEAIGRMKFTEYDLVILSEDFAGSNLANNNVLKYIQPMPMSIRRKMFVALLGKDFQTMDNMKAFSLSTNIVINFKDIDKLSAILKKSISENDGFYKVFNETLISIGKA